VRIAAALRLAVWERAGGRCEYCLISEEDSLTPHEPDHTIAVQHRGSTSLENLALACYDCNRPVISQMRTRTLNSAGSGMCLERPGALESLRFLCFLLFLSE